MTRSVVQIRIDEETRVRWQACADRAGVNLSAWIRGAGDAAAIDEDRLHAGTSIITLDGEPVPAQRPQTEEQLIAALEQAETKGLPVRQGVDLRRSPTGRRQSYCRHQRPPNITCKECD